MTCGQIDISSDQDSETCQMSGNPGKKPKFKQDGHKQEFGAEARGKSSPLDHPATSGAYLLFYNSIDEYYFIILIHYLDPPAQFFLFPSEISQ